MSELRIVPIDSIDTALFARLAACLEERFLYRCTVAAPLRVHKTVLNSARKQLFVGAILAKLTPVAEARDGLLLGITDHDLYTASQQSVFGGSSEPRRCAVVSVHRLRAQYYGEAADADALFARMLKEAVHELGRALGLKHCYNARCAMFSSTSIFDTDNKYAQFCERCVKRSSAENTR